MFFKLDLSFGASEAVAKVFLKCKTSGLGTVQLVAFHIAFSCSLLSVVLVLC